MDKFFISLYHALSEQRWLMYALLLVSSVVFVFFGLRVEFEEDISKLLPQTEKATESGLAFSNLRVKDKIFLQFLSREGTPVVPEKMAGKVDSFVETLLEKDSSTQYIANILYRIDDDVLFMGLDYVLMHVPSFVDEEVYPAFDTCQTWNAVRRQMAQNKSMLLDDEEGDKSVLIGQDPLALRMAMLPQGKALAGGLGGFSMSDRHFFSPDTTVALAFLSPNFKAFDSKTGTRLVELLEEEIAGFTAANPDVEILFHGAPVQSVFNSRQIKKDLALTVGCSLLLICVIIGLCFKSRSTFFMLLSPVLYGTFFALAMVYWIKGGMSLLAMGIGAIVLGVALSYCLHVLTHYKYVTDPVQVLREQAIPVCLGCLTTIGAFVGLLFTQSDLLRDFGIFASFALVGTTLFCLVFLPHFFSGKNNQRSEQAFRYLDKINSYPLHQNRLLLWSIIALCVICFFTSRLVTFDSDLKHIGYTDPDVLRSGQLYAEKNNRGLASMYYAAVADDLDSALEYNQDLLQVCDSLVQAGQVRSFSKVASLFVTTEVQEERIAAWQQYWNPERVADVRDKISRTSAEQELDEALFEPFYLMVESDYEPASLYDADILPESLVSNFVEENDGKFLVFTSVLMPESERQAVNDQIAALPHMVVIDPFYYTNNMVQMINNDFNIVLFVSSVFVFIVLLLSFRKWWISLVAFMPMFLSWYVVQGIMGIFGLQFNLINIVISSFIFGIGVDYSIFVMDGLLAQRHSPDSPLLTYHKTAIFFSALVLVIVVVSLLFAVHPAICSIGISTLIGMSSTVLITYTLEPFLFHLLEKRLRKKHE